MNCFDICAPFVIHGCIINATKLGDQSQLASPQEEKFHLGDDQRASWIGTEIQWQAGLPKAESGIKQAVGVRSWRISKISPSSFLDSKGKQRTNEEDPQELKVGDEFVRLWLFKKAPNNSVSLKALARILVNPYDIDKGPPDQRMLTRSGTVSSDKFLPKPRSRKISRTLNALPKIFLDLELA